MELPLDYPSRRVTVMGLGTHGGGLGVTRWLLGRGAGVTLTDLRDAAALASPLAELGDHPRLVLRLGGHRETDFTDTDLLVVNPAVPGGNRFVRAARDAGVPTTTEVALLAVHLPAGVRVLAVTGSNGKSTTAAMLHAILGVHHARVGGRAWLGGNVGGSLLDDSGRITPGDSVVLELSSFQLEHLDRERFRPDAAVVTNFAPNHLDRHGTVGEYRTAKRAMLAHQRPDDLAVLNGNDADVRDWPVRGRRVLFGAAPQSAAGRGFYPHDAANATAAEAAAAGVGVDESAIAAGLASFTPLPHRCAVVSRAGGRVWVDDSAATTPESLAAAVTAFPGALLIAGGADKGADFTAAAAVVVRHARAAYLIGTLGSALCDRFHAADAAFPATVCGDLEIAARAARGASRAGEVILLSPGCSSLDQFADYRARGGTVRGVGRCGVPRTGRRYGLTGRTASTGSRTAASVNGRGITSNDAVRTGRAADRSTGATNTACATAPCPASHRTAAGRPSAPNVTATSGRHRRSSGSCGTPTSTPAAPSPRPAPRSTRTAGRGRPR